MMATRTRPKSLIASRRKRRPGLECLEDKTLLSITFGAYGNGTFAYNSGGTGWRQIATEIPNAMHEGSDGTLFASFPGLGTFRYDYGSNQWTGLTSWVARTLSASQDNTLFASFSAGTYEFNGSQNHQLTPLVATELAAVGNNDVYMSFGAFSPYYGTWQYNSNLGSIAMYRLNTAVPSAMAASPGGALFVSYVDGTYEYNNVFTRLTTSIATQLAAVSNTEVYGTYSGLTGTYLLYNGSLTQIDPFTEDHLGNDGATLICSYSYGLNQVNNVTGTWIYNGRWNQITSAQASLVD
jgi:hypothetical protein